MSEMKPVFAITMGDPAGIGAEISVKSLENLDYAKPARAFVIGDIRFVADAIKFTNSTLRIKEISRPEECEDEQGIIYVLDLKNADPDKIPYGKVSALAGKAAYEYVAKAVDLAMAGQVDAIVTAPLNKEALNLGGYHYSGHTEILANLTGTHDYAMMLADGNFRVVHVTTHVSLRKACDLVKKDRVLTVIKLAHDTGRRLGFESPLIGVAGLNPHSGEGGLFGDEEIHEIEPAIKEASSIGINVRGPIPPDTLFAKALSGQYDFAIAMYHDQGHIPIKTAGFKVNKETGLWTSVSGINVTLGLPIIRTSVDHGTAFGKAGKGRANPESLMDAIRFARDVTI